MRKRGFLVMSLVFLGLAFSSRDRAWAQALSTTPEVPTIKGETPAFTAKGFEFVLGGFIASDLLYDTSDMGGFENIITPPRGPICTTLDGVTCAVNDGITPGTAASARAVNVDFTAANSELNLLVRGPGLWGGFSRGFFEFDFIGTIGPAGSVNNTNTVLLAPRLRHLYWQIGWPKAVTKFGDLSVVIGQAVPPHVLLVPETTQDEVHLGAGAHFARSPLVSVTTVLPMGEGNNLTIGVALQQPNSELFGNVGVRTFAGTAQIGVASQSGIPSFGGAIKFQSDFLGRNNYYGGLIPFEVGVGAVVNPEVLLTSRCSLPGCDATGVGPKIKKTGWAILGSLNLPIIGTRTEKRKGVLSVKGEVWYSENMDGEFGGHFMGIAMTPGEDGNPATLRDNRFFNVKDHAAWLTIQWNPLETLMLYGQLVGEWTNSFPPGTTTVSGINTQVQRSRVALIGAHLNLNAAISMALEFHYLRDDYMNTGVGNGFGGTGENFRIIWGTTYSL